ncbi:hypothetical protein D3C77_26030 [compost metagenome]|uniref:hypothetical protein n=1 Tax=Pseudomonas TaxID=286 RepID=UPI00041565F3|nr:MULTISPECIES: hypothetical protein [Pseudomonas]MCW2268084.1 hypothetical protein [Pseudomonas sp. JUb96]PRA67815.1 hypothetical protein CQ065_08360 [Pseudomonas sp. MYb187]
MSTLTVYFCGTGSHRFDTANPSFWNGELVSTLASNEQGREFAQWVAIDGPGSGNLQADELFVKTELYGPTGTLFGSGWEENVDHALHIIRGRCGWQRKALSQQQYQQLKAAGIPIEEVGETGSWFWRTYDFGERLLTPQQLQEQIIKTFRVGGPIPSQVNIVGWSRGGVSCHMLANAMLEDSALEQIPVNIFAIDPVPGLLNFQAHRVQLGENVKQYVGFYSRDERSRGFDCVIPKTHPSTRCHLYPLPGRHATLVGNASLDGASEGNALMEPGLIVRHFAEVCLTRWGAKLDKRLNLSDSKLQAYHHAMARDDDEYQNMRDYSYTVLYASREGERCVSLGDEGTAFSRVTGAMFQPDSGLAAPVRWDSNAYKAIR